MKLALALLPILPALVLSAPLPLSLRSGPPGPGAGIIGISAEPVKAASGQSSMSMDTATNHANTTGPATGTALTTGKKRHNSIFDPLLAPTRTQIDTRFLPLIDITDADEVVPPALADSRSRKRMTNGQRLARGLKPLPPSKKMSAPHRRSSQVPMQASPNLVVRVISDTGIDLGTLSPPSSTSGDGDGDGLLTFDPSANNAIRFQFPTGQNEGSGPASPAPGDGGAIGGGPGAGGSFGPVGPQAGNNGNNNNNGPFEIRPRPAQGGDQGLDSLFRGLPRMLIGAVPHMIGDGELKPGSPNFANLGMGQCDQGSPLDLNLPPLPLLDEAGGLLSGLPQLLGKVPGLLGINLGSGSSDSQQSQQQQQQQQQQESGAGSPLSSGPLDGALGSAGAGPGGLLHLVTGGGEGGDEGSKSLSGLPVVGGLLGGSGGGGVEGDSDGGLLGLHLPANLLGRPGFPMFPATPIDPSSFSPTPGSDSDDHSHAAPVGTPEGHFPLDTSPVKQPAQSAIWSCDEKGNMGASWTNPDGSKIPAQFFTGGPCAHTICLAADVEALKAIHGGDLAEVHLRAGIL